MGLFGLGTKHKSWDDNSGLSNKVRKRKQEKMAEQNRRLKKGKSNPPQPKGKSGWSLW